MKKILLILFLFVCLINEGKAQTVPMPDGFFQDHLRNLYPSCFTLVGAQWHMDTACNAITSEDTLAIPAGVVFGTTDIEGLQYFDNLKYFSMKGSNVELSAFSHLISMPSSLEYFWFDGVSTPNGLPVLNNGLRTLASTRGDLRFLPSTLPDSLRILAVQDNQISVLPSLPQFLERLLCSNQRGVAPATNVLTALPTLPASLKALHCSGNALSALPPLPPWPSNFHGHSQAGPWSQVPSGQKSLGSQGDYSQWGL
ncbi:MAG: hypothetical protein EOO01_29945 [Chitinophagaceae bacterium]|nr:MAG: hypothetical protein EOO01_29945 [Chitinophagaceae bacterium]